MRAYEFLIEYDRNKTVNNLGNKIYQAIDNDTTFRDKTDDSRQNIDRLFSKMEETDPTANKQYVRWIANQYKNGLTRYEDLYKLKEYLTTFTEFKPRLKQLGHSADINQYNAKSLYELYTQMTASDINGDNDFEAEFKNKNDIQVLYHGPLGTLAVPETEQASCELGKGTQWCTAATKSDNMFDSYNSTGKLYVWRDRNGEKYQFHFDTEENVFTAMDKHDNEIEPHTVQQLKSNPVVSKLFKLFDKQYIDALENAIQETEEDDDYELEDLITLDYVSIMHPNGWPELEPILEKSDELLVDYVKNITKKPNKRVEEIVARHPKSIVEYAKEVKKGRWPEMEPKIKNTANPSTIVEYAADVIKGRWPEMEPKIKKAHPITIVDYAKYAIKGRWPDAEPIIKTDAGAAVTYATDVIKGRWPDAEPIIKTDAGAAVTYATDVIKGPWPEAEDVILADPNSYSARRYKEIK